MKLSRPALMPFLFFNRALLLTTMRCLIVVGRSMLFAWGAFVGQPGIRDYRSTEAKPLLAEPCFCHSGPHSRRRRGLDWGFITRPWNTSLVTYASYGMAAAQRGASAAMHTHTRTPQRNSPPRMGYGRGRGGDDAETDGRCPHRRCLTVTTPGPPAGEAKGWA